jgi:hypothetical protein
LRVCSITDRSWRCACTGADKEIVMPLGRWLAPCSDSWSRLVPLALVLVSACSGRREDHASANFAVYDAPRTCDKDPGKIQDILDEVDGPRPTCQVHEDCPCGMYCNDGFCDADCIETNDPKCTAAGKQCNKWGQCSVPGDAGVVETELPVMNVDPSVLTVDRPAPGQPYASSQVTVQLDTTSAQIANQVVRHPSVKVRGSIAPPPGCADGDTTTACTLSRTPELEVSCAATGDFADECTLSPPWSFSSATGGGFHAERVVRVRPKAGAREGTWQLRVVGDGASNSPEQVSISEKVIATVPRAGHYRGMVELEGAAGTPALHVPVDAYAGDNTSLLLVEDTHLLSPTGRLRLDTAPAVPGRGQPLVTWLGTDANPVVGADVRLVRLDHDATVGRLSGEFTVRLPGQGVQDRGLLTWRIELERDGALPGPACSADHTSCGEGRTCDLSLSTCVPGPAWKAVWNEGVFNSIRHPALDVDGLSVIDNAGLGVKLRPTADAVERLFCYATTDRRPLRDLVLGAAVMTNTGDLMCANGVKPRHDKLAILPDAGSSLGEAALLEQCLADLALPGTDLDDHPCIALGRVYPAIALLLLADHSNDRRSALLLQSTLRQWLVTHAFVAHDGLESYRLDLADDNQAQKDPGRILAQVDEGWKLLLNKAVQDALASLPADTLRAPDYRGSNLPYMYWPWDGANGYAPTDDVEDHVELGDCATCNVVANGDGKFDRDLTVTFRTGYNENPLTPPGTHIFGSTLFNVDWEVPSDTYYTKDFKRPSPNGALYTTYGITWTNCVQYCADHGTCLAWSWAPSSAGSTTGTCERHYATDALTSIAPAPGWRTGILRMAAENSEYGSAYSEQINDGYDFVGSDYASSRVVAPQACAAQCNAPNSYCSAWTFDKRSRGCWLKGRGSNNNQEKPLPLKVPNADRAGGYSKLGAQQYAGISKFLDDTFSSGYDYRSFSAPYFDTCLEACMNEAQCRVWSWSKSARVCYLKTDGHQVDRIVNGFFITGYKPGLSLAVSHRDASGRSEPVRFWLADRAVYPEASFTVVRSIADKKYRLYRDQPCDASGKCTTLLGEASFDQLPYAPWTSRVAVGRGAGAYSAAKGVAVFPTALDDLEIDAMEDRRRTGDSDPATRANKLIMPPEPDTKNHEQDIGLPVSLYETAESELDLLSQLVDSRQGLVVEECDGGGAKPGRDGLVAQIGDLVRRDDLIEALADRLVDRASMIPCRSQDTCAPFGATCGPPATTIHIPASSMVTTGTMKNFCWGGYWSEAQSVCAFDGTGDVLQPEQAGSLGTAIANFDVTDTSSPYVVWARMVGRSVAAHSFWIRLDNGGWQLLTTPAYASAGDNEWIWQRVDALGSPALSAGHHTITVAVREDNTFLRELAITNDLGGGPGRPLDDVCQDAGGVPVTQAPAWAARFNKAKASFQAARAKLVQTSADLLACKNPLGITGDDLPLYFRDPFGSSSRYFASSDYLMSLLSPPTGGGAFGRAEGYYDAAQTAWKRQRDDELQQVLDADQAKNRRDAIAQQYESPISDLCGTSSAQPGALLAQFAAGGLRSDSCFVTPSPTCMANFAAPIEQATAGCFRGLAGEALLSMKAANARVEQGRQIWNAKQAEYEAQSAYCVSLEDNKTLVEKHYAALTKLREDKAIWDQISRYVSFAAGVASMGASSIVTHRNLGEDSGWTGSPFGQFTNGLGVIGSIVGGGFSLWGAHVQDKIDAENEAYEQEMAVRGAAQAVQLCFNQANALHDAILTAQLDMQHATIEFEEATLRFANARRKLDDLVTQGQGAVARELDRTVIRPQFHYWLNQSIASYQSEFRWAKRLAYLTLLAIEYDFQTHLPLRRQILDAARPFELRNAITAMRDVQTSYQVGGGTPQANHVVLSLTADVLKFTGTAAERSKRLREYLGDRVHRISDASGNVLGYGVSFALSPETKAFLGDRCGERVWSTTAMITTSQANPPQRAWVRLLKQNRFSSQWCGGAVDADGPLQSATIRPTRNLFLPSSAQQSFMESATSSPSDILAPVNGSLFDLDRDAYSEGAVTDFAARGLYGDYVLLFRSTDTALDLSKMDDVYLRFDILSVAN